MMEDVVIYYIKDYTLTEEHKRHISEAMLKHYSLHPMTAEHKRRIGEGQRKRWRITKEYWREQGWI